MLLGILYASCQACQIECAFVEISIVEVVLFLEDGLGHRHNKVDPCVLFRLGRSLERIATGSIYARGSLVMEFVFRIGRRKRVWERYCDVGQLEALLGFCELWLLDCLFHFRIVGSIPAADPDSGFARSKS